MNGAERLQQEFAGLDRRTSVDGIDAFTVDAARWVAFATAARAAGFVRFLDLTVVDHPQKPERFEVVVLLYSFDDARWLRMRTFTAGALASLVSTFAAANWYEREAWDLFGVRFDGHPDLTRLLLPDDFPTHPLRRDEPLGDEPVDFTITRGADGAW